MHHSSHQKSLVLPGDPKNWRLVNQTDHSFLHKMIHRFRGCLLASACGDALGYAVEFSSLSSIHRKYGKDGITEMDLQDGKAQISDDTQMSIYTAQGLIHAKQNGCNYHGMLMEIYKSYMRWARWQLGSISASKEGLFTLEEVEEDDLAQDPKNQALKKNRAPGNTCLCSLSSGYHGSRDRSLNNSKGCGGIMRVAPIAIAYCHDPENGYRMGCDSALLTHCHTLGYTSSGALVSILIKLFNGRSIQDAVLESIRELKKISECSELVSVMERAVSTAYQRIEAPDAFSFLGEGWVGEETLAIAIWAALMYPTDLKKAVVASVNHSGDSDSTGAVCGAIMGAALGEEAIPASWLEHLELKDLVCKQAEELCTMYVLSPVCWDSRGIVD